MCSTAYTYNEGFFLLVSLCTVEGRARRMGNVELKSMDGTAGNKDMRCIM